MLKDKSQSFWPSIGLSVTLMLGYIATFSDGFSLPQPVGWVLIAASFLTFTYSMFLLFRKQEQKDHSSIRTARKIIAPLVTLGRTHNCSKCVDQRDSLIDLAPELEGLSKDDDAFKRLTRVIYGLERIRQAKYGDLYNSTDEQKEAIFSGLNHEAWEFMRATDWVRSQP